MSQQIPFYFKMCATCAYWTGSRSVDAFGNQSTIDDGQPMARCMNPQSGWYRASTIAQNSCTAYAKWPALHD